MSTKPNKNTKKDTNKDTKNKNETILIFVLTISIMCNGILSAFVYVNKDKLLDKYTQQNQNVEEKEVTVDNAFCTFDDSFLIKLQDNSYLKIGINMGYDAKNKKIPKEIEEKLPKLKDKTLAVILTKNKKSFQNDNLEIVKEELLEEYNKVLLTGKINNIYFTELIQQ